jgi:hypothetical protein
VINGVDEGGAAFRSLPRKAYTVGVVYRLSLADLRHLSLSLFQYDSLSIPDTIHFLAYIHPVHVR